MSKGVFYGSVRFDAGGWLPSKYHGPALPRNFEAGVKAYVDILDGAMRAARPDTKPDDALAAFATMVGALVLSRAIADDAYAARILDAAAARLLDPDGA